MAEKIYKGEIGIRKFRTPIPELKFEGILSWIPSFLRGLTKKIHHDSWQRKYNKLIRKGELHPYESSEGHNLGLTSGLNEMWDLIAGASANHFDNTNARIGIGDDKTTAPADTQTDLQAASNKTYKAMDAGYPTAAATKQLVFKSTFTTSDANYEWGEFVIKQNVSGKCLNRSTNGGAGWGTKTSSDTWVATATLSLA